eukprot:TRINITY_DN19728_c0_g1_i1.p1 TRINITY_DN19728_c0_g1~~TRINITY_DN19728_c0_g1_i1.p1  ORF type:complete len:207 (-),score=44.97 TRINITY_DN19728_c0_g1_i1:135-701(-)
MGVATSVHCRCLCPKPRPPVAGLGKEDLVGTIVLEPEVEPSPLAVMEGSAPQIPAKTLLESLQSDTGLADAKLKDLGVRAIHLKDDRGREAVPECQRASEVQKVTAAKPSLPIIPRARSAPLLLPLPSRVELAAARDAENEADLKELSPVMKPEVRSPSTAVSETRRKKRRHVTFGAAQYREFQVDAE